MLDWLNRTGGWVFIILGGAIGLYGSIQFILSLFQIGNAIALNGLTSFLIGATMGAIAFTALSLAFAYFLIKRGKSINDSYK